MTRLWKVIGRAGLLATTIITLGCDGIGRGPDATSSLASAQVKGKVTLAGKPVLRAQVVFNPSNVNRKEVPVASSPVKDDGTYEVTTLVGQNQVSLTGPGVAKNPKLAYFTKAFEVKSGTNELDISIP